MTFSDPGAVINRLSEIENDMAARQNAYESAARKQIIALRQQKHARAVEFMNAEGSVAERTALAERATALDGMQEEAEYVALKAVMQTLSERASVGQSILRAQARQ